MRSSACVSILTRKTRKTEAANQIFAFWWYKHCINQSKRSLSCYEGRVRQVLVFKAVPPQMPKENLKKCNTKFQVYLA
jgi:hypothetical protein